MLIQDKKQVALLIESTLHAIPEGKASVTALLKHPALFPFDFPSLSGDSLSKSFSNIELIRHVLDDEILMLNRERGIKN